MIRQSLRQIGFGVLALIGLSLGAVPAWSAPEPQRLFYDLDGDHKTDVASSRLAGWTYRIHLQLSDRSVDLSLLAAVFEQPGLRLIADDIDGDNDLDLVLTGVSGVRPIAVWLNDGKGRFTRTSRWRAPALGQPGPALQRSTSGRAPQPITGDGDPVPFMGAVEHIFQAPRSNPATIFEFGAAVLAHPFRLISTRGPPRL